MKRHTRSSAITLALHLRPLIARVAILLLLSLSLGMVIVSRTPDNANHTLRTAIADVFVPVVGVLAKPADAFSALGEWVHETVILREENRVLKDQNTRLQQWQAVATELQSENGKLRALLKFAPTNKQAYTSARVAVDSASPYSRSALITSGADQGVEDDLAVINDSGLVGRVVEVGKKTSRILLLTDMNSRIPVLSETSRERSIAGGNNSDTLTLVYLPEDSKLKVGEKIVTSGDGGVLPPGLPVGVVTKIEKGMATVKPFVDWYHLEYVSVVDFSM